MNKAKLEGRCLGGGKSIVEVTAGEQFGLYVHHNSATPVNISYGIDNIFVRNHSVTIGDRTYLHVVEHLFSALFGMHIYDVRIDVYGEEIPFFDGSSQKFVNALDGFENGHVPRVRSAERIEVAEGNSHITYLPMDTDDLIVEMSLIHPHIGTQRIILKTDVGTYRSEIAPARTFVFTDENDPRLQRLPPYGIGITEGRMYSATPLRFPDEPVRHKLLDLLGDLYVLRRPFSGKIIGVNTSHQLNVQFARQLSLSLRDYV